MKQDSFIKKIGLTIVLFVLLLVAGIGLWQYAAPWRLAKIEQYKTEAEQMVSVDNGMGVWELEKAYWMGMDYQQYRQLRAIYLMALGDDQADSELSYVVEKQWLNDGVNFWYGTKLFNNSEYPEAKKYLANVNKNNLEKNYQLVWLKEMAYLSGLAGDWQEAEQYVEMAKLIDDHDNDLLKMTVFLDVINENLNQAIDLVKNENQFPNLSSKLKDIDLLNGDLLVLKTADLGIDLKLGGWSRKLIDSVQFYSLSRKYIWLVYGRSWLEDHNCSEAIKYFWLAREQDGTDDQINDLLQRAYSCQTN